MTLFEDGNWRLVDGMVDESSIMHKCPPRFFEDMPERNQQSHWWFYTHNGSCTACDTQAPDALVGLKALHDWER